MALIVLILTLTATGAEAAPSGDLYWIRVGHYFYQPADKTTGRVFTIAAGQPMKIETVGEPGTVDVDLLDSAGRKRFDLLHGPSGPHDRKGAHHITRTAPKGYGTYRLRVRWTAEGGNTFTDTSRTVFIVKKIPSIPKKWRKEITDIHPGTIFRFDPCQQVTIAYNDRRIPASMRKTTRSDLRWAARHLTRLTGHQYRVVGHQKKGRSTKVLVNWGPLSKKYYGLAKLEKTEYVHDDYYKVTFARITMSRVRPVLNDRSMRRTVMVHELMHAAGRGHATSNRNVMATRVHHAFTKPDAADRYAMRRLGRGGGCL